MFKKDLAMWNFHGSSFLTLEFPRGDPQFCGIVWAILEKRGVQDMVCPEVLKKEHVEFQESSRKEVFKKDYV